MTIKHRIAAEREFIMKIVDQAEEQFVLRQKLKKMRAMKNAAE
jgi:hypothetical protein